MRAHEVLGGIYVMISEDESNLLADMFSEAEVVKASDLSERQVVIAEDLVKRGVLNPTLDGFKLV